MNLYSIIDKVSLGLSGFVVRKSKYFRDNVESKTFKDHIDSIKIQLPEIGEIGLYELKIDTLEGEVDTAFKIAQWKGKDYPTIIYQHGVTEIPFDMSFNKIFPIQKENINANLIAIRAPFHNKFKEFLDNNNTLNKYVAMFSVSVNLMECLVQYVRKNTESTIVVSGVSLGGFSSNLHHTFFNTADIYKPLLAGANIGDALLDSAYSKMMSPLAKDNSEKIKEILDFTKDFTMINNSNVYPLLGKYDQVVLLEREIDIYKRDNLAIIEKGHATGASSFKDLKDHILSSLKKEKSS